MKKHSKAFVFFAVSKQIPIVYSADRGRAENRGKPGVGINKDKYSLFLNTRIVPEVRRQRLKCFKMTSDIEITLHVCTCTSVFDIVDIHNQ